MGKGQAECRGAVIILCRAQKSRAVARYAGRCPGPRQGRSPETPAPFPSCPMFQNGPRRQGYAPENLFKTRKDFPSPRTNRAPLTAPGRSENLSVMRKRGRNAKSKPSTPQVLHASRWSAPRPGIAFANQNTKGGPATDRFAPVSRLILQ
jgi:hypothetical protein